MDLTEFLNARLDEDALHADHVHRDECAAVEYFEPIDAPCNCGYPSRVLADIAAKRRRLALYIDAGERWHEAMIEAKQPGASRDAMNRLHTAHGRYLALHESAKLEAAPYVDHPDFRPEWRIDASTR